MTFSSLSEKLHMPKVLVKRAEWWKLWRSDNDRFLGEFILSGIKNVDDLWNWTMCYKAIQLCDNCASHASSLVLLNSTWAPFMRWREPLLSTVITGYMFKLLFTNNITVISFMQSTEFVCYQKHTTFTFKSCICVSPV